MAMAGESYYIDDLVDSLEAGRAVAFLGSGISVGAGLPDWPKLLTALIERGRKEHRLDDPQSKELMSWAAKPDHLMLASAIQRQVTPPEPMPSDTGATRYSRYSRVSVTTVGDVAAARTRRASWAATAGSW